MTNAEARFNKFLRPRKPEGSLGRTAQDVHLDSHTAPELWGAQDGLLDFNTALELWCGCGRKTTSEGKVASYVLVRPE